MSERPSGPPSPAQHFLDAFEREHATTMKVLRAFPPEQADFRPHERSSSARVLAWTFVVEERFIGTALRQEPVLGAGIGSTPMPDTWEGILDALQEQHDAIVRRLRDAGDAALGGTVRFFTGPKQVGEFSTSEFVWFMLCDQIHHRGQLSVYVRMAGGKVPSIYGPTADEPWT